MWGILSPRSPTGALPLDSARSEQVAQLTDNRTSGHPVKRLLFLTVSKTVYETTRVLSRENKSDASLLNIVERVCVRG